MDSISGLWQCWHDPHLGYPSGPSVPSCYSKSVSVHEAHVLCGPGTRNRNTKGTSLTRGMKAAGGAVRQSRPWRQMDSSSTQPLPASAMCYSSRGSVCDPGQGLGAEWAAWEQGSASGVSSWGLVAGLGNVWLLSAL